MVRGKFLPGTADHPGAILGVGVETALGVESDRNLFPLALYLPKKGASVDMADPMQSLSTGNIGTVGAFAIQQDFDNTYVITNIGFVKQMLNLGPDEYSAGEIAVVNPEKTQQVRDGLQQLLGSAYTVQTRYEQNRSLYTTMQTEKWFIFVLLSFILVLAAFTMIGALTMLVLEKQKDIQILKAMGCDNARIRRIFLTEGLLLAIIGGGSGVLLSFIVGWLQVRFKLLKLEGSTFLIDYYPVKFLATDITLVFITVLLIALFAAWFPARKAAAEPIELRS
jgi:lipoprotein-releasing system permease protein